MTAVSKSPFNSGKGDASAYAEVVGSGYSVDLNAVSSRPLLQFACARPSNPSRPTRPSRPSRTQRPYIRNIVGALRLWPWWRLFTGVNPADSKGEAREGKWWSFEQSLERWRHQYQQFIPSHPIPFTTYLSEKCHHIKLLDALASLDFTLVSE